MNKNLDLILKKIYEDDIQLDTVVFNQQCYICMFEDLHCIILVHNELDLDDITKLNLILSETKYIVQQKPLDFKSKIKYNSKNFKSLFEDDNEIIDWE